MMKRRLSSSSTKGCCAPISASSTSGNDAASAIALLLGSLAFFLCVTYQLRGRQGLSEGASFHNRHIGASLCVEGAGRLLRRLRTLPLAPGRLVMSRLFRDAPVSLLGAGEELREPVQIKIDDRRRD